ncbi:unnamed protein product [Closterium sp. NIES-54]
MAAQDLRWLTYLLTDLGERPRSPPVLRDSGVLAFDAEGRAIDFDVWIDDLQLFLQCDRADGLSLFDLTSGVSHAPPATADSTVCSQWATRDAAARLAEPLVVTLAPLSLRGVPPPFSCPLLLLLLRPTSVGSSRSVLRLPLAGAAALAGTRGAGALVGVEGAVEVVVEAVEGVGVVVGVVAEVEVSAAAVGAAAAVAVAEGAEAAVVAEAAEAVVELVAAVPRGAAPVVVRASSSSAVVRPPPPSSSVSGTLGVSAVEVLAPAPTFSVPATAQVSSAVACTPPSAASAA